MICVLLMVTWICEFVNSQKTVYKRGQFFISKCSSISLLYIFILNINIYICKYIHTYVCAYVL